MARTEPQHGNAHPTPSLSALPGHEGFMEALAQAIADDSASKRTVVVLVDVDLFGAFNEAQGRAAGDALLEDTARIMAAQFGEDGVVARYGGDAFAAVLPGWEREAAFLRAEAARRDVEGLERPARATVSVGVAMHPDDAQRDTELVRKVNEALYRAKVSGRNRVCLAQAEKMITKTSHYGQGQLAGLSRLAKRLGVNEAALLREALDDLLRKHND